MPGGERPPPPAGESPEAPIGDARHGPPVSAVNTVDHMARERIRQGLVRRGRDAEPAGSRMVRAVWNGAVIAESDQSVVVEGDCYFPPDSVRKEHLVASDTHTTCFWKGQANYCSVRVDDKVERDAAWYYPHPSPPVSHIAGYIAFWQGVSIEPCLDASDASLLRQVDPITAV